MRIILDTDPGVDDAVALLWLLALDSRFQADIVGITTTAGNISRRGTFDNAARLLKYCRRDDLKLGRGAPHRGDDAKHIHGEDGLAGIGVILPKSQKSFSEAPAAPEQLIRWLEREPNDITLLAIGPVTNLAAAEKIQPGVLKKARQIVITGGAFQRGNVTEQAEFNANFNATAFKTVINSGANTALIPLDITRQLDLDENALLGAGFEDDKHKVSKLMRRLCRAMIAHVKDHTSERLFFVHDACAIAYVFHPELFETVDAHIDVEVRGEDQSHGKTTIRGGGTATNMTVLRRMDASAVRQAMLEDIYTLSKKLR